MAILRACCSSIVLVSVLEGGCVEPVRLPGDGACWEPDKIPESWD